MKSAILKISNDNICGIGRLIDFMTDSIVSSKQITSPTGLSLYHVTLCLLKYDISTC